MGSCGQSVNVPEYHFADAGNLIATCKRVDRGGWGVRGGLNIVLKCSRMEPVSNEDKHSTTDHFPGAGKMVRETSQWITIR